MPVVGMEEVRGLTNLEVDVAWGSEHCLRLVEIKGKREVINLTRFVLGGPYRICLPKPNTSLEKRAEHLWSGY